MTITDLRRSATHPTDGRNDRANRSPTRTVVGRRGHLAFGITRILLGSIFLWAFFDKLLGLGRATPAPNGWLDGGSPTTGFLSNVQGPFFEVFQALAGNAVVDVLFMVGLVGIGSALVLGIGMRITAVCATLLMIMMWAASLPLENNPVIDEHLVYAAVIIGIAITGVGAPVGLGQWWAQTSLVQRVPALR